MNKEIVLSQSFMKAMNHGHHPSELEPREEPKCPMKAKAIYLDGHESPPTESMIKGLYFESIVFDGSEDGKRWQMERKKDGGKTTEQLRVESQAVKFKTKIRSDWKMDFAEPRKHIKISLGAGTGLYFLARIDLVSSMMDEEGVLHPKVIIDTKIAADAISSMPPFCWGSPHLMDHTQAVAYTWAYEKQYGVRIPFWYIVMDVSTKERYRRIGGTVTDAMIEEFKVNLKRTIAAMQQYDEQGWPVQPSHENCTNCPLKSICPAFAKGNNTVRIW